MDATVLAVLVILGLLLAMLLFLEIGRRFGARRSDLDSEGAKAAAGLVNGAVYGLMGLLIAFTFSGAAARFDTRRQLVVEESNDIGTAWLRLDLLPQNAQPSMREKFRRYVDSRINVYQKLPDIEAAKVELTKSAVLQNEIWSEAVAACRDSNATPPTMLLLPAINQMIDITSTRTAAAQMHPPALIYATLMLMLLIGSLLAGYGMAAAKRRDWFHTLAFIFVMSLTIYVILDFEFPRVGLIRIHAYDQVLIDLRNSMN